MHSKLNQAITLHPLFFDPVNKKTSERPENTAAGNGGGGTRG